MTIGTEPPLVSIRTARLQDIHGMAEAYVASWRDSYPHLVPDSYLLSMSVEHEATAPRRRMAAVGNGTLLVAESANGRIVGLAEAGPIRHKLGDFNGELFVLYIHPDAMGKGIGIALFQAARHHLSQQSLNTFVAWVLSGNPARWFYESQGGKLIASRSIPFAGRALPAVAYGWRDVVISGGG